MSELVTGEAVALELRPAKLPSRALAVLIDLIAAFAVYIAVSVGLLAATASLDEAAAAAVSVATFLLVLVGAPIAVETLSHGRSLGKLVCGLRVVRDDGGPIRFRHALVRGAMGVIEILATFGVVACIASLVSARGRRLGDVFAGTLVVRERVPAGRRSSVPPPPPWLVGSFSALDLSAVPDGLWLAVRQYLTRMGQLDPRVGAVMAERLAGDLVACTGTPMPHGVPHGAYLAAVLHERQTREARRAFASAGTSAPEGDGAGAGPSGAGHGDRRETTTGPLRSPEVSSASVASGAPVGSAGPGPAGSAGHGPGRKDGGEPPPVDHAEPGVEAPPATGFVPPA